MLFFLFFFQIQDNWKFHKSRVASYWQVKLDSIKRRKARKTVALLYYCFKNTQQRRFVAHGIILVKRTFSIFNFRISRGVLLYPVKKILTGIVAYALKITRENHRLVQSSKGYYVWDVPDNTARCFIH